MIIIFINKICKLNKIMFAQSHNILSLKRFKKLHFSKNISLFMHTVIINSNKEKFI